MKTALRGVFLLLFAFTLSAKKWDREAFKDSLKQEIQSSYEYMLLDYAYETKSDSLRQLFFDEWMQRSDSLRANRPVLTGFEKDAYEIYMCIFNEFEKLKLNKKYLVVQGNLYIRVYKDQILKEWKGFSNHEHKKQECKLDTNLNNFAPHINYKCKEVLILSNHYYNVVNTFLQEPELTSKKIAEPFDDIMRYYGDSERKLFIIRYLPFFGFHWGSGYHITNFPQVGLVFINESRNLAVAGYRFNFSQGGSSILVKQNGSWKVSEVLSGWIE